MASRAIDKPCVYGGARHVAAKRKGPVQPRAPMPRAWISDPRDLCRPPDDAGRKAAMESVYGKLTAGRKPAPKGESPHLVMSVGPPGAGKSTISRLLVKHASSIPPESYVEVDFDSIGDLAGAYDALKNLPDLEGRPTGVGYAWAWASCDFSTAYSGELLRRLMDERYNLIVQSHDQQMLIDAQMRDYVCTLFYVAVSRETALRRAAKRAEETGRFLQPANAETGWGWKEAVNDMWTRYRERVPWYALWADNLALVSNEVDGKYPGPEDFRLFIAHPPLEPEQDWHGVISGFYAALADVHGEKSQK